ncbi:YihY/virulence factor BrkB family protein [Nocardioidaceae bacterium]|nr:YihY/virulence factor BrkB family protein [Nocardioidaceae bacterium]
MPRTDPRDADGRAAGASRRERVEQRVAHVGEARDRWLESFLRRLDAVAGRLPRPLGPAVRLSVGTVRASIADRVGGLAAEAALFTLISLPALFLVVLGSLGYVSEVLGPRGEAQLDRLVLGLPRAVLTDTTYARYQEVARQVLDTGRVDIIGLGLLLGLWTGSRATHRLLGTMTIAYDLHAQRSVWRQRVTAIWLTAVALLVALIVLPTVVVGPRLARELLPRTEAVTTTLDVVDAAYWPVVALVGVAALTQVYQVGTPGARPWRRDLPGAALAVTLCVTATLALLAYLRFTGVMGDREGLVYQQLGTPIAIVFWIWGSCIAVLVGAELNAQIERMWPSDVNR